VRYGLTFCCLWVVKCVVGLEEGCVCLWVVKCVVGLEEGCVCVGCVCGEVLRMLW